MAATLSLDTITSSGSTITVPAGKTLAITDDGALTIGTPPVAITTGATQVTGTTATAITMATTGSPTINITGKSTSIVSIDASGGASVTHTVTLPTPATFSTTSIIVMSRVAHGASNKIVINDSGGTEVYTLYEKGDHCELVSDGTNTIRTGNEWVTVTGRAFIDTDGYPVLAAYTVTRCFSTYVTTDFNVGSWWDDVTNYRITAGFDCDLEIHAQYTGYSNNGMMPVLKHLDSSAGLKQWYNYPRVSTEGGYYQGAIENTFVVRNMSATDYLEFYNSNNHSSSQYFTGDTDGTGACFDFRVLRRH